MEDQNYSEQDILNNISQHLLGGSGCSSPTPEHCLYGLPNPEEDMFQGTSILMLHQHLEHINDNQIRLNISGYGDSITNQAGSGLQDEQCQNSTFTIPRFSLTQNDIPEQSVELESVQYFRSGNGPQHTHGQHFDSPSSTRFQEHGTLSGISQQCYLDPNNGDKSANQIASIRPRPKVTWRLIFLVGRIIYTCFSGTQREGCKISVLQPNDSSGMLTIKVPALCFQISGDVATNRLNGEIEKALRTIVRCSTLEVLSPNAVTTKNIKATHAECFPGNKQHCTQKRKRAQEVVNDESTKTKVINRPTFGISNCASSSSPLSSSPRTQNCTKFTKDEIELLIKGVEEHRVGDWLEIKQRCFNHSSRTNRQLQDKWTNLVKTAKSYRNGKLKKKCAKKFANFYDRVLDVIAK